ncbi:MAG: hypothetical protein ABIN91_00930 [Mucilaginibacter sp.]
MSSIALVQNPADPNQEPHDNITVALLIFLVLVTIMIWRLWPNIIADSVFSKNRKYDYGRSEEVLNRKRSAAHYILIGAIALALAGITLSVYDAIFSNPDNYHQNSGLLAYILFFISFVGIIACFVYALLDESSFSDIHNLKYSLKVWITTMLAAPLVLLLMDHKPNHWSFPVYINTVVLGHGISIITLTILIYGVHYLTETPVSKHKRRLTILLIVQTCLLLNMFIVALILHSGIRWLLQVLPYCVIIGVCIWFYPMDKTVYSKEEFYESEVIE